MTLSSVLRNATIAAAAAPPITPADKRRRVEQPARQVGKRQREAAGEDRADGELALRADVPHRGAIAERQARPHHDQRRRLDRERGEAAGLHQRRDEEGVDRRARRLPERPEHRRRCRGSSARSPAPATRRSRRIETLPRGSNLMGYACSLAARAARRLAAAPPMTRPICSIVASLTGIGGDSRPPAITATRSQTRKISSRSCEMITTAAPFSASSGERAIDRRRRAGVDAPGRLVDDQRPRRLHHFAPDQELLQIAARQRARLRFRAGGANVEPANDLPGEVDASCA